MNAKNLLRRNCNDALAWFELDEGKGRSVPVGRCHNLKNGKEASEVTEE